MEPSRGKRDGVIGHILKRENGNRVKKLALLHDRSIWHLTWLDKLGVNIDFRHFCGWFVQKTWVKAGIWVLIGLLLLYILNQVMWGNVKSGDLLTIFERGLKMKRFFHARNPHPICEPWSYVRNGSVHFERCIVSSNFMVIHKHYTYRIWIAPVSQTL